jgi:hypothetical protein
MLTAETQLTFCLVHVCVPSRVDLGKAMVRATELDETEAQGLMGWLLFWLLSLRVVGWAIITARERSVNPEDSAPARRRLSS